MRIAAVSQRLCLIKAGGAIDVHAASNGQFDADPAAVYPRWREFTGWAASACPARSPSHRSRLGSLSPAPRQVYGIGLNYSDHVAEPGFAGPDTSPPVFTKFPTRRAGSASGAHRGAGCSRATCSPATSKASARCGTRS